ncbi:MAG: hypothetical protein CMH41_09775 [Micrococcales bacterium]|nr:hypothetical protein [Micrococcales bacterium]
MRKENTCDYENNHNHKNRPRLFLEILGEGRFVLILRYIPGKQLQPPNGTESTTKINRPITAETTKTKKKK